MRTFKPHQKIGVGGFVLSPREKWYLKQVIASNRLSYGPMTERLERLFARLHDCRHAIFCNSGTSALHVALGALKEYCGWKDGDEVLVPAVTFVATSNIVLHNRMKPIFVDVDPVTYTIDPRQLEKSITSRTRAIIPVHLMGLPCDMDAIQAVTRQHRLRIIEDSAETMFASYRSRKVGSFGDIACFSTYIAHFIITGVGGFATTNNPELAVMLRSLVNHGRDHIYLKMTDDHGVGKTKLREIVAKRFSFVRLGHSFRATEMEAAIGLGQIESRQRIIRARRANAAYFAARLKPLQQHLQLPYTPPDRDHMFMLYPLVLRHGSKRALVNYLEERKIETRDLMPLVNQPIYKELYGKCLEERYPIAQWLNRSGFYIGCHQYMSAQEKRYVADTLLAYFQGKKR